jgi:hypothetical protein
VILAYAHHAHGGLVDLLLRSAIWHVVGRLLYRVPGGFLIPLLLGFCALYLFRGRRRRPRIARRPRWR